MLFLLLTAATCSDGSTRGATPEADTPAIAAPTPVDNAESGGTGDPASAGAPAASDDSQTASAEPQAAPEPTPAEEPAPSVEVPVEPPDIFHVMQASGFTLESEQDLADYLPIPPRAEGQVGRFVGGGETVTVSRVTYPEAVFATPHEQWIRERMTLLPDAHERVVRDGATVIHIRAQSSLRADEVRDLFLDASATDDGS